MTGVRRPFLIPRLIPRFTSKDKFNSLVALFRGALLSNGFKSISISDCAYNSYWYGWKGYFIQGREVSIHADTVDLFLLRNDESFFIAVYHADAEPFITFDVSLSRFPEYGRLHIRISSYQLQMFIKDPKSIPLFLSKIMLDFGRCNFD